MSDVILSVEGISKKYQLGQQHRASSLRESLGNWFGRKSPHQVQASSEFWALKDISFDVRAGDRVGIIGRNGAGKSTLLKILSRIVEPTEGRITVRGRVASLLEVGTGFHPELTGRENIYLNGAILGMSRQEIRRKFDEIVDFAEVEKFLDTPVKRYSSGMYVRLAFAVAAHLEPEILIVDEVLAVGDVQFQKKCLGKMESVSGEGRTILFVSHNMEAIRKLCNRALILDSGTMAGLGDDVQLLTKNYLVQCDSEITSSYWQSTSREQVGNVVRPLRFFIGDDKGATRGPLVRNDDDLWIYCDFELSSVDSAFQIGYALYNSDQTLLYWCCHTDGQEGEWPILEVGNNRLRTPFPKRLLNAGKYRMELIISNYYREWLISPGTAGPSITFEISGGLSESPYWSVVRPGQLAPVLPWQALDTLQIGKV